MELSPVFIQEVADITGISIRSVTGVLTLLITEECTIPFVSRYRKEKTGGMDEVQIQKISETYNEISEREKRREFILETLKKREVLTAALEKKIKVASTLQQLEDLYAPFKGKQKTKGQLAKEAGIEPLADIIKKESKTVEEIEALAKEYVKADSKDFKEPAKVLDGAMAIIIEEFSHHIEAKETLRKDFWREAVLKSSLRKEGKEHKEAQKFKDYFEFDEPLKNLLEEKNTHRFLAMRRAMGLKILKLEVDYPKENAESTLKKWAHPDNTGCKELVDKAISKAYSRSIYNSLDLEIKSELKKKADEAAISVFGINLKNLLLQPFLGAKAVIGVDPGVRTGCKVVLVDDTGKLLFDSVIYPHEPRNDVDGSAKLIEALIEKFKVAHIAVGNGTYGRETLEILSKHVPQVKSGTCKASLISESGASIYSASDIAREEFPDKDVTVRGAVSIARRFQDPLAELVKIDPKSIGVGQYQHDVNQAKLKKSLEGVVESCVNFVGVNVNTASKELLSYVSGIGPAMAKSIVKYRDDKGTFKNREELLKVPRLSEKVFQQAAGFLRIKGSPNPLDSTGIHPEVYPVLETWAKTNSVALSDLMQNEEAISKIEKDNGLKNTVGEYTLKDLIDNLRAPGHDPRDEFEATSFREDAKDFNSIKTGEWYPGVVTNITKFGAFVDIGIKENGLLHISQMSDNFVSDPFSEIKVGESVKVKVLEIDHDRKRISLTRKGNATVQHSSGASKGQSNRKGGGNNRNSHQAPPAPKSPFAALKDFKVNS